MDGKQNIIDKILLDAQTQCEQILQQANQKADDISSKAQQTIDKQLEQLQEKLKQDSVVSEGGACVSIFIPNKEVSDVHTADRG